MPNDEPPPVYDADLTASLRSQNSDAAMDELYRRHRSAVLSYAYTCCRDPHTAEDLTSEAFARTLQAVRSGSGPEVAWRPYLLAVVRRTAAQWANTARRTELSPDFEQWFANVAEGPEAESSEERILRMEDSSLVLRAFRSLPERWQTVLWHTAVEGEPAKTISALLGMGESGVSSLASRARERLREAYLAAHAASDSGTDECRHYSAMLGAVVRRKGLRRSRDFDRHLAQCGHCSSALIELTDLNERMGAVLPAGVLLWGGSAYVAARLTEAGASTGAAAGSATAIGGPHGAAHLHGSTGLWAKAAGSPTRSAMVAGSMAAAIALAVLILPIPFHDHPKPGPETAPSSQATPIPPPVRLTATSSTSPASTTPSAPSVTASASKPISSAQAAQPVPPSSTGPGFGAVKRSIRLYNTGYGTCVEPSGSELLEHPCNGSQNQVWNTYTFSQDPNYTWLRNAATGDCIDYSTVPADAENLAAFTAPCQPGGTGQLFRFDPWEGDAGAYYVSAHSPWDGKHLGSVQYLCDGCPGGTEERHVELMRKGRDGDPDPFTRYVLEDVTG